MTLGTLSLRGMGDVCDPSDPAYNMTACMTQQQGLTTVPTAEQALPLMQGGNNNLAANAVLGNYTVATNPLSPSSSSPVSAVLLVGGALLLAMVMHK